MRNDEILTVKETAALLKTTRQQVRKMIANEELPAVKVGREWRVLKAGIMEFFAVRHTMARSRPTTMDGVFRRPHTGRRIFRPLPHRPKSSCGR